MTKQEQIEEMAKIIDDRLIEAKLWLGSMNKGKGYWIAEKLIEYYQPKLPIDSVVLLKEEYEKLRSLYDCEQGSYMTSSIGDLPLTVEGLRKAVDEITRLNRVETELQELNIKYYNEAKDLRRELKQVSKETAEKIFKMLISKLDSNQFLSGKRIIMEVDVENLAKQFNVEIKEYEK